MTMGIIYHHKIVCFIETELRMCKSYSNDKFEFSKTGTDTLSYTASALSFMLENLGKTVIVTGSQVNRVKVLGNIFNNIQLKTFDIVFLEQNLGSKKLKIVPGSLVFMSNI